MKWMPIETAPIGIDALFFIKWSNTPVIGQWDGRKFHTNNEHYAVSCGAFCYGGSVCTETVTDPTHWMPLPEPPQDFSGDIGHE